MLPTIFPLPYGTTAIKGRHSDNSIGDALRNISKTTSLLWSELLLIWSKPFADAILHNPTTAALPPHQQWANNVQIQSEGLTDDKEEDWAAIKAIHDACNHLLATNVTTPTASSVIVTTMAKNQSVLTSDSTLNGPHQQKGVHIKPPLPRCWIHAKPGSGSSSQLSTKPQDPSNHQSSQTPRRRSVPQTVPQLKSSVSSVPSTTF